MILTNLGRIGSPLIRYRTGDLVRAVRGTCACGTHDLALEGGILGRTDDMVVVRGVNIYPTAVEEVLRAEGVTEYRVEVRTERALTQLHIQVEGDVRRAIATGSRAHQRVFPAHPRLDRRNRSPAALRSESEALGSL